MAAGARHVPQRQVDHKTGRDRAEDSRPHSLEKGHRCHVADAMPSGINDESTKFVHEHHKFAHFMIGTKSIASARRASGNQDLTRRRHGLDDDGGEVMPLAGAEPHRDDETGSASFRPRRTHQHEGRWPLAGSHRAWIDCARWVPSPESATGGSAPDGCEPPYSAPMTESFRLPASPLA
jgi:hypothetical protein